MPIITNCPTCQSKFQLPDNLAGKQVQCQNCNAVFVAPQVNAAAPQPAAPQPPAPPSSSGSFASVFDEVSAPASYGSGGGYGGQQSAYPGQGGSTAQDYEGSAPNYGLLIGILATAGLLIVGLGVGAWFMFSGGEDEVADKSNSSTHSAKKDTSPKSNTPSAANVPGGEAERIREREKLLAERAAKVEKQKRERELIEQKKEAEDLIRKEKLAEERKVRDEQRAIDRANSAADREGRMRDNEPFEAWIKRSFQLSGYRSRKFLEVLESQEVQSEHLELVSNSLCTYLQQHNTDNFEEVTAAMLKWRTEDTDQAIMDCVGNEKFKFFGRDTLMKSLSTIGTAQAAEKLAVALDSHSRDAKGYLTAMGSIAEPAVIPYLDHQNSTVRRAVYEILSSIGTRESLSPLARNLRIERNDREKAACQTTVDAIKERHPEEPEEASGE